MEAKSEDLLAVLERATEIVKDPNWWTCGALVDSSANTYGELKLGLPCRVCALGAVTLAIYEHFKAPGGAALYVYPEDIGGYTDEAVFAKWDKFEDATNVGVEAREALDNAARATDHRASVVDVNDTLGQDATVKVFEETLRRLREQES